MALDAFPVESLTFTGLGAEGSTPHEAAERLATALNEWAAAQAGRRLLQISTVAVAARPGAGLAALLVHTAGPDLAAELGAQVAAVVEEAEQQVRGRP